MIEQKQSSVLISDLRIVDIFINIWKWDYTCCDKCYAEWGDNYCQLTNEEIWFCLIEHCSFFVIRIKCPTVGSQKKQNDKRIIKYVRLSIKYYYWNYGTEITDCISIFLWVFEIEEFTPDVTDEGMNPSFSLFLQYILLFPE